jgi:hypothetical protein
MISMGRDAHGMLFTSRYRLRYHTAEPAPDQWIAVGTVMPRCGCRLLRVGRGRSEAAAIADLEQRALAASCPHDRDVQIDLLDLYDDMYADVMNV